MDRGNRVRGRETHPVSLSTAREFLEDLKKSVKTSLEAAGYSASYQSSQKWPASYNVSSSGSQGGVTLFFGSVCENCGESLPYRVANTQGSFGGRVAVPHGCDAAAAADCLVREAIPLLTNRLPAAVRHNPGIGAGLLTPQQSGEIAQAIESHAGSH